MDLPDFLLQSPDGSIRVNGHRIGLQHVVYLYNEGYSPEMLREEFPTLALSVLHRVIAFYLEHQTEVDDWIAACRAAVEQQVAVAPQGPGVIELRRRIEARRRALAS